MNTLNGGTNCSSLQELYFAVLGCVMMTWNEIENFKSFTFALPKGTRHAKLFNSPDPERISLTLCQMRSVPEFGLLGMLSYYASR